jgi:predicted DNA-binding ribbon-helix-helix protein
LASGRPVKHSLTLSGHRTSVSLEDVFWQEFRRIAAEKGQPLNALAAEIDAVRDPDVGLASSIRVFVLEHLLEDKAPVAAYRQPQGRARFRQEHVGHRRLQTCRRNPCGTPRGFRTP